MGSNMSTPSLCRESPIQTLCPCRDRQRWLTGVWLVLVCGLATWISLPTVTAAEPWEELVKRPVLGPEQAVAELRRFCTPRITEFAPVTDPAAWPQRAAALRDEILRKAVLRGAGDDWRQGPVRVEWFDEVAGGPGYTIRKLRYEAVPGLWIPAILYQPTGVTGPRPVFLNVNGHDPVGKAADYKQIRCLQLAKRGIVVLNPEWLGMGQLRGAGYLHGEMNQLDLVGTSGLAPFYLAMSRGLDLLLGLPDVDPTRVGVSGLSGGGWQTIVLSALDTRVTLCNPVAGFSSLKTRMVSLMDLGDSEQTPVDLATVADYTHLTALLAPRPALLTYNLTDNCCFQARDALPPLLATARPLYRLLGADQNLRYHINAEPGDHNFGLENREALYAMVGVHFFDGARDYPVRELPMDNELKTPAELTVPLPEANATFGSLARGLAADLPRGRVWTQGGEACRRWQPAAHKALGELLQDRWKTQPVVAAPMGTAEQSGITVRTWQLGTGDLPTLPVIELVPAQPQGCVVLAGDLGKGSLVEQTGEWLRKNWRVCLCDPVFIGENAQGPRNYLFALVAGSVGARPAGLQGAQLAAVARWRQTIAPAEPLELAVYGPRIGLAALLSQGWLRAEGSDADPAAADTPKKPAPPRGWSRVVLHDPLWSLHEVLERNRRFEELPEAFLPGLLQQFDMVDLAALVWPVPVEVRGGAAEEPNAPRRELWRQLSRLGD